MQVQDVITTAKSVIGCDGGGGALGHPMVYLTLTADGHVECPYCSRRFVRDAKARQGHGH
jgi:uncharacterized Zn-finger protein